MSNFSMTQPFSMHSSLVRTMNPASENITAGAPIGQHTTYWPQNYYIGHEGAAESLSTAHGSTVSMTDGIAEQARILEGMERMEVRIGEAEGYDAMKAATSFTAAPSGANAESNTNADWTSFTIENYYKVLKTLYTRNEEIESLRDTNKDLMTLADKKDVTIQNLEAHIEKLWKRISRVWKPTPKL
ncbi:hypothetical protein VE02_07599 [Pseudogymnoascus sp. 03VT05]|nr:hypothetical protein VE02_07599 [Pseudogymnoascus sp. 03VT05]